MKTLDKLVISSDNFQDVDAQLEIAKIKELIIEDIESEILCLPSNDMEKLIIRNTKNTRIYINKCQIDSIICEYNKDIELCASYCNLKEVSGKYDIIDLYFSELNYSNLEVKELTLDHSYISHSTITIEKELDLDGPYTITKSVINIPEDSPIKDEYIIYNQVGSRSDNLIIDKKKGTFKTGCFIGNVYKFIVAVYIKWSIHKYFFKSNEYKYYEEYLDITDKYAKEMLYGKELIAYKALKLYLKLKYKFNNPYKK